MALVTKIILIGSGSKGLIIPSDICQLLDLQIWDKLSVDIMGNGIILKKIEEKQ